MTLQWEERLLPATSFDGKVRNNFGPLLGFEGIIWHTMENGGFSRLNAENTITWQKDVPGSYNFVIFDGGLFLTIPYQEASGGINPSSASWAPERFPWLQQSLSSSAYGNPTKYHLQVAFSGRRSAIDAGLMPANMLATALALRDWWQAEVAKRKVLQSGHMHWQSNRTDPGIVFNTLTHATLPDTSTEDPMPNLVARIDGQRLVIPRQGIPLRLAATTNGDAKGEGDCYHVTLQANTRIPALHGEAEGTDYDIGGGRLANRYYVFVAHTGPGTFTYGYVPKVYGAIEPIQQPTDCGPQVQAATDPLYRRIDNLKAISADGNKRIQNG